MDVLADMYRTLCSTRRRSTASAPSCSRRSGAPSTSPAPGRRSCSSRATFGDQPIGWPDRRHARDRRGDAARRLRRARGRRTTCPRTPCSASPATRRTTRCCVLPSRLFGDMPDRAAPPVPAAAAELRERARRRREARDRTVQPGHRAARAAAQGPGPLPADGAEHDPRPRHEFAAVQGSARAPRPRVLRRLRRRALQRHRHDEHQRRRHARASRGGDAGDPRRAVQDCATKRRAEDETTKAHATSRSATSASASNRRWRSRSAPASRC